MTDGTLPAAPPALECIGLGKRFGSVAAVDGFSLTVFPGELVAILGPSGCGKTTALRLIAGFETPDSGSVRIDGQEVVGSGTMLAPERRRVGMVFQDYALFPHLTVAANVRYGLTATSVEPAADDDDDGSLGARLRRWTRVHWRNRPALRMSAATAARVREALDLVALGHLAGRYPHELSGGEAQRVALARVLAPQPALILLDEPFSNLDSPLRASVRSEVRQILRRAGAAAVFVTHDQEEAFSLAGRVAVIWEGRIEQVATPQEIYRRPASRALAEFVGDADFLPGRVEGSGVRTEVGLLAASSETPAGGKVLVGSEVEVMLRPEMVRLASASDEAQGGPVAEVIEREYYGHDQLIAVRLPSGRTVRARLGPSDDFHLGDRVRLQVAGAAALFPR